MKYTRLTAEQFVNVQLPAFTEELTPELLQEMISRMATRGWIREEFSATSLIHETLMTQRSREAEPILRLEKVSKSFPNSAGMLALGNSISHLQRRIPFVIGPSGCGKTTLLRIMAGFFRQQPVVFRRRN